MKDSRSHSYPRPDCPHETVFLQSMGDYQFVLGDVQDNLRLITVCGDCGETLHDPLDDDESGDLIF